MTREEMIRRLMVVYAGGNYAAPREVVAETLDFFAFDGVPLPDIAAAVTAFAARVEGLRLAYHFESRPWGDDPPEAHIDAYRKETPEETAERIEEYRQWALGEIAKRRAKFERMKAEFADDMEEDEHER